MLRKGHDRLHPMLSRVVEQEGSPTCVLQRHKVSSHNATPFERDYSFLAQFTGNLRVSRTKPFGKDDCAGIHNISHLLTQVRPDGVQSMLR